MDLAGHVAVRKLARLLSLCFGQKKVSWNEQKRDRHQGRLLEILLQKRKKESRLLVTGVKGPVNRRIIDTFV